jgi:Fe-S-cluster containining protein
MVLEERIRNWQQGLLSDYCRVCSDTCCDAQKHGILFDDPSLPLFQERGIPVIKYSQLEEPFSVFDGLYLKDGYKVGKPSIVEVPKRSFRKRWMIYADMCPFYNKEKECEVHEDPKRPEVCKQYPIVFLGCNDPQGRLFEVRIKSSCEYSDKLKSEIVKEFPVRVLD